MSSLVTEERTAPRTRAHHADRVRWALLLVWVLLLAWCVGFAERPASFRHLEDAAGAGQVHRIEAGPPGVAAGATGYGEQEVHWREGLLRHRATVMMTVPGESDPGEADVAVRRGHDAAAVLRARAPHLQVTRVASTEDDGQVYGWWVPRWLGYAALLLVLVTLGLLIHGPRPRWATRWAWFWLMATPVGTLAFLVLSGPTPGLRASRTDRRLRGGWGFLLAVVSSWVLPTWWASG